MSHCTPPLLLSHPPKGLSLIMCCTDAETSMYPLLQFLFAMAVALAVRLIHSPTPVVPHLFHCDFHSSLFLVKLVFRLARSPASAPSPSIPGSVVCLWTRPHTAVTGLASAPLAPAPTPPEAKQIGHVGESANCLYVTLHSVPTGRDFVTFVLSFPSLFRGLYALAQELGGLHHVAKPTCARRLASERCTHPTGRAAQRQRIRILVAFAFAGSTAVSCHCDGSLCVRPRGCCRDPLAGAGRRGGNGRRRPAAAQWARYAEGKVYRDVAGEECLGRTYTRVVFLRLFVRFSQEIVTSER
jgi:hypothetical protein